MEKTKTNRERIGAILRGDSYDRVPLVHLGFWPETVQKWAHEGHITMEELSQIVENGSIVDGSCEEQLLADKLGLENSYLTFTGQKDPYYNVPLYPPFEETIVE